MPNQESYFAFAGTIDQQALHRLFNGFGFAMGQGVERVHLLFQSTGGLVSDGVCLYNYFKGLPIELAIYNAGSVASVATIAFLGVERRYDQKNGVRAGGARLEQLKLRRQKVLAQERRLYRRSHGGKMFE